MPRGILGASVTLPATDLHHRRFPVCLGWWCCWPTHPTVCVIPFPSRFPHVCPPSLLNVLPFPNTLRRLTVIRRKVSASADCLDPPTPRSLPTRNPSAVSLFLSLPGECTFGHCTPFPPLTPVLIEMSR
eukprot:EG_transcript_27200